MIICKTPFRLSLFGGGTDIPSWFNLNKGKVISLTFNRYNYTILKVNPEYFKYKYVLKYFKNEKTNKLNDIKNKPIKYLLKQYHMKNSKVEITHSSELPGRMGIGSSSAFVVSLINILNFYNKKKLLSKKDLAINSINLERNVLKEFGGFQDQIACSYGGFNKINFFNNSFKISKINLDQKKINSILKYSLLISTNQYRNASQIEKIKFQNIKNLDQLSEIQTLCDEAEKILNNKNFNLKEFSLILNETWNVKRSINKIVTNNKIDQMIDYLLNCGCLSSKLIGAGNGGFIFVLIDNQRIQNKIIQKFKHHVISNLELENNGSKIILTH